MFLGAAGFHLQIHPPKCAAFIYLQSSQPNMPMVLI